jgi:hypothetical protein
MLHSDQSDERCYDFVFLFLSIDVTLLPSTLDLMSLGCWLMFRRMRSMLRQAMCSQCDAAISLFASVEYIPQDGATLKEPLVGGPLEVSPLNVDFLVSHLCVPRCISHTRARACQQRKPVTKTALCAARVIADSIRQVVPFAFNVCFADFEPSESGGVYLGPKKGLETTNLLSISSGILAKTKPRQISYFRVLQIID